MRKISLLLTVVLISLWGAEPAAASGPANGNMIGSTLSRQYPAGRYPASMAGEVAVDLLIKHYRTIGKCGVNLFVAYRGIRGAARLASTAAKAGRIRARAQTVSPETTLADAQYLIALVRAEVQNSRCIAAVQLIRGAMRILVAAIDTGSFYFRDASTHDADQCRISVVAGDPSATLYSYSASFSDCSRRS